MPTETPMVETELIQRYGQAVVRIATAADGGVAVGTSGLAVRYQRNGQTLWTAEMRSDDDKIRPTQRIRGLAFSDDGNVLYVAASDEVLAIDVASGDPIWSYRPPRSFGFLVVSPVALDSSGDIVAASFDNGSVVAWDTKGTQLGIWKTNDAPRMLRLLPNAQMVGTDSFSLCLWDVETRATLNRRRLADRAMGFDVSPTGIVIRRSLRSITVENMFDHSLVAKLAAPPGPPLVAINAVSDRIAYAGESTVTLGPPSNPDQKLDAGERISALTYSPFERAFLVGLADGRLLTVN